MVDPVSKVDPAMATGGAADPVMGMVVFLVIMVVVFYVVMEAVAPIAWRRWCGSPTLPLPLPLCLPPRSGGGGEGGGVAGGGRAAAGGYWLFFLFTENILACGWL